MRFLPHYKKYISGILIVALIAPFGLLYNPREAKAIGIGDIGKTLLGVGGLAAGTALTSCYGGSGIAGRIGGGIGKLFKGGGDSENAGEELISLADITKSFNEHIKDDITKLAEKELLDPAKEEAVRLAKKIPGADKVLDVLTSDSVHVEEKGALLDEAKKQTEIQKTQAKIQKAGCQKDTLWDTAAWFMAKMMIRQLTRSIVGWINTGNFDNSFSVLNTREFWTNVLDETTGVFLDKFKNTAICKGFKANINISLRLNKRPFEERFRCTLSDVLQNNYDAFQKNFSVGGWDSFANVALRPQNDPYATYFFTMQELERQKDEALRAANQELNQGNGFLGLRVCKNNNVVSGDPLGRSGKVNLDCNVQTPGVLIENALSTTLSSQVRQLELADEFNEIVVALLNKVDMWNVTGGGGGRGLGNYSVPVARPNSELLLDLDGQPPGGGSGGGGTTPPPIVDPAVEATRARALSQINNLLNSVLSYETARVNTVAIIKSARSSNLTLKQCIDNQIDILNLIATNPTLLKNSPFNAVARLGEKEAKSTAIDAEVTNLNTKLTPFEDDLNTNVLPITSRLRDALERVNLLTTSGGIQYILDTYLTTDLRASVATIAGLGRVAEEDFVAIKAEFKDFSLTTEIDQCATDLSELDKTFRQLSTQ